MDCMEMDHVWTPDHSRGGGGGNPGGRAGLGESFEKIIGLFTLAALMLLYCIFVMGGGGETIKKNVRQ